MIAPEAAAMGNRTAAVSVTADPAAAVRRSALWAAWGDALGFPTELVRDAADVTRRVGASRVVTTTPWRRRIGGRVGMEVELPAGMYSDDTQLRLAVGRCIRSAGRFDAEVFSKVELPVFLSYGFGIGRGTRAAAQSLAKRSVRWYNNFFDTRAATYVNGGGNGAAMRIQPHVWAAPRFDPEIFLPGVLRDSVTTHGHLRGILGAALHALSLGSTLRDREAPDPSRWTEMVEHMTRLPRLIQADDALRERWLPMWEKESGTPFGIALEQGLGELTKFVEAAQRISSETGPIEVRYAKLAQAVGGLDTNTRGSGTASAILALWLAHASGGDAIRAVTCASNLLGSDTDTIASMAGALVGVTASDELPGPLVDAPLIVAEAERLALLATGAAAPSFAHPDPLRWLPPRTQSDALGMLEGEPVLAGLGRARIVNEAIPAPDGGLWQWLELEFGQTVLVKRRERLPRLGDYVSSQSRLAVADLGAADLEPRQQELPTVDAPSTPPSRARPSLAAREAAAYPDDVEEGVAVVVKSRFEMLLISKLLMHYARQEHGVTKAAVFASLVAEALREHDRRTRALRPS